MFIICSRSCLALALVGGVGAQANEMLALPPNPFKPNDSFVIAQTGARLMRGDATLATLPRGLTLQVLKIDGPWIGTTVMVDGRKLSGWVWASQAASPEQYRAMQSPARRRYSLAPAQNAATNFTGSSGDRSNRGSANRIRRGETRYGPSYWRADRKILGH